MRRCTYKALPLFAMFVTLAGSLSAQATGGGSTLAQSKETDINAIRLAVAQGTIDFINNAKRPTLLLEWDYLPVDRTFLQAAREQKTEVFTIHIENRDLQNGSWSKNPKNKSDVDLLSAAFQFDLKDPPPIREAAFLKYWQEPGNP